MFKKSVIALSLLTLPLTASANWSAGGGYAKLSDDLDGDDLSIGMLYGTVAYEFNKADSPYSIMPEISLGTGISDDKIGRVEIEVDRFFALSLRGQYNYDNGAYLFVQPSYANLKVTANFTSNFNNNKESDDNWEFGFGAGVGKKLTEKMSIEAAYSNYDDTDLISIGFKYDF